MVAHQNTSEKGRAVALAERSSLILPLIGCFCLPIIIGLFFSSVLDWIIYPIAFLILLAPVLLLIRIIDGVLKGDSFFRCFLQNINPIPPGLVWGTDLKRKVFPWATFLLIISNIFIFYTANEEMKKVGVFPPYGDPGHVHTFISIFTSAFLHGDFWHLMGNMFFLWAFGSAIETRLGAHKFIALYFLSIFISTLLECVFLIALCNYWSSYAILGEYHSLGASGAISGIMGLFAVRCFFAKVTMGIPFLFIPFISMKMKFNGIFLVGFFFAMDVSGSMDAVKTEGNNVAYWSHVGGYLGGFVLGYLMKLHNDAAKESIEHKIECKIDKGMRNKEVAKNYQEILEQEPEHENALRFMFDFYQYNKEKASYYYGRLLDMLSKNHFTKAIELFDNNYPNYIISLSGQTLMKLGLYYYKRFDLEKASTCLEFLSEQKGPWRETAMFKLAIIYREMEQPILARNMLKDVINSFPDSPFQRAAKEELDQIPSSI